MYLLINYLNKNIYKKQYKYPQKPYQYIITNKSIKISVILLCLFRKLTNNTSHQLIVHCIHKLGTLGYCLWGTLGYFWL